MSALEELVQRVRNALHNASCYEAPTRKTRSSGKTRYVPSAPGFRIHIAVDPAFVPSADCISSVRYVGVGCANETNARLGAYETFLRTAGFDVRIDRTHARQKRIVWVTTPVRDSTVGTDA